MGLNEVPLDELLTALDELDHVDKVLKTINGSNGYYPMSQQRANLTTAAKDKALQEARARHRNDIPKAIAELEAIAGGA